MQPQTNRFSGFQSPYGANVTDGGTVFSFASHSSTGARLLIYDRHTDRTPARVINFDPELDRQGDLWKLFVSDVGPGTLYHYQVDGPYDPQRGNYFDGRAGLIDPYARALAGDFLPKENGIAFPPKCVVVDDAFDWSGDRRIKRNLADEVIYELHVRGFTCSPSSNVQKPGTFLGLIEKIPYLRSLGVTAVELMPVHEFPRNETNGSESIRKNYWGYDPIAFFAPHRGYAWDLTPGAQVREFKQMVKEFHQAGIEVFLDVVFNHTAERGHEFEVFSFKGLENRNYYVMTPEGEYANYSGCGNTCSANSPWMSELIVNCLRSWVCNYHVDGFRFDLASVLSRGRSGELLNSPPIVEEIAEDPMLADVKLIAEAWDAGGAYQVGNFGSKRWAEWNGKYRDNVRQFWRGDEGMRNAFVTRLSGSSDLYQANDRGPTCSINFITSHDGFTLNDLVSYNEKHNHANGEENRDGDNNNFSYNYGVEGPTNDFNIRALRTRQVRNFLTTLFFSQGVPMLVAGDEAQRTQRGNNNAYCQDTPLSWFDWSLVDQNADLIRFCSALIHFRSQQASLRRRDFFCGLAHTPEALPDVSWYDLTGEHVVWNRQTSTLTALISPADIADSASGKEPSTENAPNAYILLAINASTNAHTFSLPEVAKSASFTWRTFVDTSAYPPYDVYPEYDGPIFKPDDVALLPERTMRVLLSDRNN